MSNKKNLHISFLILICVVLCVMIFYFFTKRIISF